MDFGKKLDVITAPVTTDECAAISHCVDPTKWSGDG